VARSRSLYRTVRTWHLYAGLFASPFVLIYAASAIMLNHAFIPWGAGDTADTRQQAVTLPTDTSALAVAKSVRSQIGVPGEIGYVSRDRGTGLLSFPIETPGSRTMVRVDPSSGLARVATTKTGVGSASVYLHRMPGPHNVSIRGNWVLTRAWGWVADANVYLLLFVSVSGIYLWIAVRAERRTGLIFLFAGAASFAALVMGLVA
jgi:hypothetical protein